MKQAVEKNKLGLRDYWQIFLRRKWVIILPVIIIISIAVPGSFILTPIYRTSTTLISEEMERGSILSGVTGIPIPPSEQMGTIRLKIASRRYMKEVADKLRVAEYLKSIGKPADNESILKYLRRIVRVNALSGRFIEISVTHPIPTMAKEIADTVADVYVDKTLVLRQSTAVETAEFVKRQMDVYWQRLTESEESLVKAQEKSPLGYLSEEADTLVNEGARLKTELFEAELDLGEAKNELEKAKRFSEDDVEMSYTSAFHLDPDVSSLQTKLTSLQTQHTQLSMRYTYEYPEIKKLESEIAQTKMELDKAKSRFSDYQQDISGRLNYWQDRVRVLEAKRTALNDKIGEYDRRLQLLPQRQLELARLQRDKSIADNTYSMLMQRLNTLELLQSSEVGNMGRVAEVLDKAVEPDKPLRPNRKRIAFLAVVMGIAVGFGSAFLLEYFDRSFRSVDEVVNYLEIPVLATIPKLTNPESELKKKRHKRVKIAYISLISILVIIMIADIASAELLARDSLFLSIARRGLNFLRNWKLLDFLRREY